ncbi:MAG: ribonuclease III [Paludibacteraceae bacterium]|nr:ribonuclease III [Paludibacteraceae bacterium]
MSVTDFLNKHLGGIFRKKDATYAFLTEILGFAPKNIEIYKTACIHRSSGIKDANGHVINNERLEFLGDSVLSTVTADLLYKMFPEKDEGELTSIRSKLVKRETLDNLALKLGLNKLVVASQKYDLANGPKVHIGGNAFEALIGAIYIDLGYTACLRFVQGLSDRKLLDFTRASSEESNFKSKLIEWAQQNKYTYDFRLVDAVVNKQNNTTMFKTEVFVEDQMLGTGVGFSKKQSQQEAAKQACDSISRGLFVAPIPAEL